MRSAVSQVLGAIARVLVHAFFRRVEVVGTDRIPRGRPLLVVANHFNGFVDPVVLAGTLPRPPRFVAKATLGRFPPARALLKLFGVVLVQRTVDAGGKGVDNRSAFVECHTALRRGSSILIFPEGTTHDLARMVELKTGAARIALGARAAGVEGLLIVPAGLTFPDKVALRSAVLVRVGEPIDVDADVPPTPAGEEDRDAVRALTDEIQRRLRVVTPDFDDVEEWWSLDAAAEIVLRTEDDRDPSLLDRTLLANRLGRAPARTKTTVRRRLADYVLALSLARLRDREVVATGALKGLVRSTIRTAIVVAVLAPLVLAGSVVTAAPAALVAAVGLVVTTPVTKGTVRVLVALVAFPTAWGIAAAQLADGWAVLGLIVLWAASGWATVVAAERAVALVFAFLAWRTARERVSYLEGLHAHRAALVASVAAASDAKADASSPATGAPPKPTRLPSGST